MLQAARHATRLLSRLPDLPHLNSPHLTPMEHHLIMSTQQHFDPYPRAGPELKNGIRWQARLITGGGYGVGSTIVKSFAEVGVAEIILLGRTEAKLKSTAEKLASFNNITIRLYEVDISSKSDVKKLFDSLTVSASIPVNNAGFMATPTNFILADLDEYWEAITIHVYGTALITQSFLGHRETLKPSAPAVVITLSTRCLLRPYSPPLLLWCQQSRFGSLVRDDCRWCS